MVERGANLKVASWGEVTIFYTGRGLRSLLLWHPPVEGLPRDGIPWPNLAEKLEDYFRGRPVKFDFPLDLDWAGPFTARVLRATAAIPYGETMTYGQMAASLGKPKAARAVGRALASNRLPVIIPCHRVICTDGGLGGFSAPGGCGQKQQLLDMERAAGRKAV